MYEKILNFIKYNNAFTIVFVICFFSFGISFAASTSVRDSVYASKESVISVDNSLILSTDLDNFNFNLKIDSVTEDDKTYYATYSYETMEVENSVWQKKDITKTLTVNKEALLGKDFGLYLAKELGENINYELSYLRQVQKLEQEKGKSQKVVTIKYSGLIGKFLNPKEKVIEGYTAIIPEPVAETATVIESEPQSVIVSTQHPQQEPIEKPVAEPAPKTVGETAGETTAGEDMEHASTSPSDVTATSTPGDIVNNELVQQVVHELLQTNASSTPATDSTTTPAP